MSFQWRAAAIVGTGVVAALNIGKLPPALTTLRDEFALSLVQVSWMVALFAIGASLLGMAGGSIADRFGPRRTMIAGLLLLAASGALAAVARAAPLLFLGRALESIGFLLTVLPAPVMLRRQVRGESLRGWLGVWGAYMPAGMSMSLFAAPALMSLLGWRGLWFICAGAAFAWALLIAVTQPRDPPQHGTAQPLAALARATVGSPGPWLLSLCFMFYAGQFIGIFSFLPDIYRSAGIGAQTGASLTGFAVLFNMIGNVAAGLLMQRGVPRWALIVAAGATMAACAYLAFGSGLAFGGRYAAIVVLSTCGGLIPGALFATAPFYAPSMAAVSTTVGMMQQGASLGQVLMPLAIASLAQATGGWSATWVATGTAALVTITIGLVIRRLDEVRHRRQAATAARGGV